MAQDFTQFLSHRFLSRLSSSSIARCILSCGAVTLPATTASAGDNLWNLRENGDDRFHSNEAHVRPWRYNYDDAVGRWVGNYSYEIPWGPTTLAGDGDGNLSINRGRDRQFSAWTFVFVAARMTVTIRGGGDCVPHAFWKANFDAPQIFRTDVPPSTQLEPGWHRVDITGYNQNDSYNAYFQRPEGIIAMNHVIPVGCLGDMNSDGFVNDTDFQIFVFAYDILECSAPSMPENCLADFNRDGGVDDADFVLFVKAYNTIFCI